MLWQDEEKSKM